MAKKNNVIPKSKDTYPKTIETFKRIGEYELNGYSFNSKEPSCFNGNVNIKKYKITIEIIDEPVEVYHDRLEKLWVECDNHHHWTPLQMSAAEIGYKFKGERGSQRKK